MIPRLIEPSAKMTPFCDQCGAEGRATCLVGEKENWDSRTASICQQCLLEALSLFPGEDHA